MCIASGSVASLPDMVTPLQRAEQWRRLPSLNGSKMVSEYFRPVADLKEARSLAQCILPGGAPSDDILEEACWRAGGSLGKLIDVLNNRPVALPCFDGARYDALFDVLFCFAVAFVLCVIGRLMSS